MMQSVFLLLTVLLFSPRTVVCAIVCRSPASRGECRAIEMTESKCHNSDANYAAMRLQCCPRASHECCDESHCQTSSNQWTRLPSSLPSYSSVPSTSHNLTLSPSPVDCSTFSLTVSWPAIKNVTGYSVAIYRNIRANVLSYHTTTDPMNTALTLPNLCYDSDKSKLHVELWKRVASESELVATATIKRKNCYTLYGDDIIRQRSNCGPIQSDQMDQSDVRMSSVSNGNGTLTTDVSWPAMANVTSYALRIARNGKYLNFNATNTNSIIITGLNYGIPLRIKPYMECAGMYLETGWDPCSPLTVNVPQPAPKTVSTVETTVDSSTSEIQPSHHSPHTPPTTSTSPLPSSSFSSPSSSSPSSSSPSSSSTSPSIDPAMAAGLATVSVTMILVFLTLTLCLICALHHKKQSPKPPLSSPLALSALSPSPTPQSSLSSGDTLDGYIPYPELPYPSPPHSITEQLVLSPPPSPPHPPHSVWVLYSLDTSDEEKLRIHKQLGGLTMYDISLHTPGTMRSRDVIREWLEAGMTEASAILLVCNQQFYDEWRSECDGCGGTGVKIGREAKVIKNNVNSNDLPKYAYVHFEKTDQEFDNLYRDILTPYITRRFSLAVDRDTLVASVAKFVQNLPDFEIVCSC